MPELDPLLLSRIQFAFTISFHILFPSFTIGLAAWLVVLEALWLKTGKAIYMDIALHWTKIFAVSFAMGVVSGIVLSYEFGTNWSRFSLRRRQCRRAAHRLRGADRLLPRGDIPRRRRAVRLAARATGAARPLGHSGGRGHALLGLLDHPRRIPGCRTRPGIVIGDDGIVYPADWLAGGLLADLPDPLRPHGERGLSDHRLRRGWPPAPADLVKRTAAGASAAPCSGWGSSMAGSCWRRSNSSSAISTASRLCTRGDQPAKIAAVEAHWETDRSFPLILFAIPDPKAETNHFEIAIPSSAA